MTRKPKLESLRMFEVAARRLNFRLVAEELALTQSAVAQRVRQLEQDLGVALFVREPRGLALTARGRHYHATISQALSMIDEATRALSSEGTRLTLSVPPSFAAKWLVPRLHDFRQAYPHLDLQLEASERLADFQTDDVDFAVRLGVPPFGNGLHWELLTGLNLCLVCSPDYLAGHGGEIDSDELAAHTLISDAHDHWAALPRRMPGQARATTLRVSHTSLAIDAASAGQGLALAPGILVSRGIREGTLIMLRQFTNDPRGFYLSALRPDGKRRSGCCCPG
ncbi:LysR substrate-binding domain-containing protein [Oceanisphaera psychrotolerans]|uniref:HTH lysR-type domain-containing protein n=1 Tax=Oceanisphaera psychrotolerans TaxID=1414654 RepID=A0A1J4QFJ6_9GAMM|nr:LysR substrate-binding domain-containing protein [Oceanisphaera psychrotolerans]OIN12231.1 hypothetical protein BFR47_00585 [Oceanisphaera psychrotolerans]